MIKPHLLIPIALLAMPTTWCRAQRAEELLGRMSDAAEPSEQLDLLARAARVLLKDTSFEEAAELAGLGAERSRELDLAPLCVEFELMLAECADRLHDPDNSLAHALRAMSYNQESDKMNRARCTLFLAELYMREGVFSKAQDFSQQAIATGALSTRDRQTAKLLRARALMATKDRERARECLNEIVNEARNGTDHRMLSIALGMRAVLNEQEHDIAGAIADEQERLDLARGSERGIILNNIGELHARQGAYEPAHHYFGEAATWLALDPDLYGRCLMNSAVAYARQGKYLMAEQTIGNAINMIGGRGTGKELADAIMLKAAIHLLAGQFGDALTTARQALEECGRVKDREKELQALDLLARISLEKGALIDKQQYDLRAFTLRQELAAHEAMDLRIRNERENALHRQERDITLLAGSEQRQRLRAREATLAAEFQANEFGLLVVEKELQDAHIREEQMARERAQQDLSLLQATMARERQDQQLKDLREAGAIQNLQLTKLDLERKQKEQSMAMLKRQNDLLEKDGELKAAQQERSDMIMWSALGTAVLLAGVAAFFFWVMRKVKGKNRTIRTQVKQIEEINAQLSDKNADLLSSINYAQNIQRAIIPTEAQLRELLPDSFLHYRPRDIVSGDLPFIRRAGSRVFVATIDCTGHGVPAAMLSFMAYYNLNDIISTQPHFAVNDILDLLHQRIREAVHAHAGNHAMSDGMDLTLVELDLDSGALWYSGAQNSLLIVRNGECQRIKGDKCSIGDPSTECDKGFRAHRIDLLPSDRVYLFSDGLIHQFGGSGGRKKFSNAQLMRMVSESHESPAIEQGLRITGSHTVWQGETPQTDDIVFIGFSIERTNASAIAA